MRYFLAPVLSFFYMLNVSADTLIYANNNASTGKIIIDGYDMGQSASSSAIRGSGVKSTLDRKINRFSSLIIDGQFDIIYRDGKPSLTITGDNNIIKHVTSDVNNGRLSISINQSYSSYQPIVINVSSNRLGSVTLEGASTMVLDDINTDKLKINLLGTVDVMASGRASTLDLNVQGTGDIKARELNSDYVSVNLEGTGDIELTAREALNVDISGVGDIYYFGNPNSIRKQISGVGDVEAGE